LGSLDIFQNKVFKTLKQAGQRGSKKDYKQKEKDSGFGHSQGNTCVMNRKLKNRALKIIRD
jgi:hypothetical protein